MTIHSYYKKVRYKIRTVAYQEVSKSIITPLDSSPNQLYKILNFRKFITVINHYDIK